MAELPPPKFCECGHRWKWYVRGEPDTGVLGQIARDLGFDDDVHQEKAVVERLCPHRNGTRIEHCPACDRKVGMWGMGAAGGMECACWDGPDDG